MGKAEIEIVDLFSALLQHLEEFAESTHTYTHARARTHAHKFSHTHAQATCGKNEAANFFGGPHCSLFQCFPSFKDF